MIYLKYFKEAVLSGKDVSNSINDIRNKLLNNNSNNTIEEIDIILNKNKIYLIEIEEFRELFPKQNSHYHHHIYGLYGGYITKNMNIFILFNKVYFPNHLKSDLDETLKKLINIINHELVHREQYKKIKIDINKLNYNRGYYEDPSEIMANAKATIDELLKRYERKTILSFMKLGIYLLDDQKIYKKLDQKSHNRFRKYMYQYLMEV